MLRCMKTEQEKRSKWNEVKISIIKFILNFSGPVPEPDIRENLKNEYKISNRGNIKKHLSDLRYRPYSCIEIIPAKPGFANHWEIKTTENLKNILLHFPEIRLNKYDKSVNIVLKKSSCNLYFPEPAMFKNQLVYSASLFKRCLENEPETLYGQAMLMYRFGAGFGEYQSVKKDLIELFSLYLKYCPSVEISEETFLKMPGKWSREILAETVEILPEKLFEGNINKIVNLLSYFKGEYLGSLILVFELNVSYDIFIGPLSPVEMESSFRAKDNCVFYGTDMKINLHDLTTNTILSNLSLNLENLDNCIDASTPELATGWIEFQKCWLEEYTKFLEFENEFEELNKELKKLMEECQRMANVKQGLIQIIRRACKGPKMLYEEYSDFFAEFSKKIQTIHEEREKITISTPFPESSEEGLKLIEESAKLDEEISEFASKSPKFKEIFEKLDDLNEKLYSIKEMRRENLIRRFIG